MKSFIAAILAGLCAWSNINAQIAGLTGTKAVAIATDVIPKNTIEFSPTWSFNRYTASFDESGESTSNENTERSNGLCWMISYGLGERTEVGINITNSFEPVSFAMKHLFFESKSFDLGAILGINLPLSEGSIDPNLHTESDFSSFGFGLIGKLDLLQRGTVDFNFQIQDYFEKSSLLPKQILFFTAEYGTYVLKNHLALLVAINFQENIGEINQQLLSAGPGISIEAGENFLLVFSTLHDFLGRQAQKGMFAQCGLTIILD